MIDDRYAWAEVGGCKHFMKEPQPSRNGLCHMNPLSEINARDLTTKLEWWEALVADSPIKSQSN